MTKGLSWQPERCAAADSLSKGEGANSHYLLFIKMALLKKSLTVKKLDDISEVHVVITDNLSINFHKC